MLVLPYQKRVNRAERCIRYYKNAVIGAASQAGSGFTIAAHTSATASHFEAVLNVLHPCTTDASMSTWEWMHGAPYNYNRHPLLPLGLKVTVYDQPRTKPRGAWGAHGSIGRYVGPAFDHYRCYKVVMADTIKIRVTSTLECHPTDVILPGASRSDRLTAALSEMADALRGANESELADNIGETERHQLRQPHAIFTERTPPSTAEAAQSTPSSLNGATVYHPEPILGVNRFVFTSHRTMSNMLTPSQS
jgi:hypothetical protein